MKIVLGALLIMISTSVAFAGSELLEGKTASGAKCSVRMDLDKDLVTFAAESVAFGFLVSSKKIDETLKKGQKSVIITGNDGPVSARLTLNFSDAGVIESANYSQKTFLLSKRVKCSDLK